MSEKRDDEEEGQQCLITVEEAEENELALLRVNQLIWTLTGFLEVMIGLRVFLKLIAANPQVPFARLVYGLTDVFLLPFFGLTITPSIGNSVLEISSLIAMAVYFLVALGIIRLIRVLFEKKPAPS